MTAEEVLGADVCVAPPRNGDNPFRSVEVNFDGTVDDDNMECCCD